MTRHESPSEQPNRNTSARTNVAEHDARGKQESALARLSDMDDFEIADGEPDIRGWDVRTMDGRKIGEVDDLLVDTGMLKVRYLEMKLDDEFSPDRRHTVVPIGVTRLDDDEDEVVVNLRADAINGLPPYTPDGALSREHESALIAQLGKPAQGKSTGKLGNSGDFYGQPYFDDNSPFEGRRAKVGDAKSKAQYITRSEEELAIGKRNVSAGAVGVSKRVETEHVRKTVPVTHEEVTVERRPVSGDRKMGASAEIKGDEIRIPLMQEEVVASKRTVAKEEIVIKKHAVQGEQVIEADLRKERVDIDRKGKIDKPTNTSGKTPRKS